MTVPLSRSALLVSCGAGALFDPSSKPALTILAEVTFLLARDAVWGDKLEQTRSWCLGLPLGEMISRSKDLMQIDRVPDAQDEALTYTCCSDREGQAQRQRKDRPMNPQMQTEVQLELSKSSDITVSETDLLAGWGFTPHEIASLLWLRQWYQTGGSDRATLVRHLEFLRRLVHSGDLEL